MQILPETPRVERTIAKLKVQVPQPYAEGQPLTAITAAILNQTFAENISNNTRARLESGVVLTEGAEAVPHTPETAQAAVDAYIATYEPGVKRGGGEARVTDPVEREARKIAKERATDMVKTAGGKTADYDMGELTDKVFEANKEFLMAEGKKIVKALEAARAKGTDGINLAGIDLTPKPTTPAATEGEQQAA